MSERGRGFTFLPLISAAGRTPQEEGEHGQRQAEPAPRYLQTQYWCAGVPVGKMEMLQERETCGIG